MEHLFLMFLDHTRRSTVGRTPLDEWSARRRDFYLTTHDTHNRLRSWVRIPPGAWIFVCCECRVLSGRGLCDELITRPEESYLLWCVVVCDLETSRIGAPYIYICIYIYMYIYICIYMYIYIYDISSLRVNIICFLELKYSRLLKCEAVSLGESLHFRRLYWVKFQNKAIHKRV